MKTFMCILLSVLMLKANASATTDSTLKQTTYKQNEHYWVLETGKTDNNSYSIVRFYDANNNLVFEKKLTDIVLKGNRSNVQRKLNKALKAYVAQPSVTIDYLAVLERKK